MKGDVNLDESLDILDIVIIINIIFEYIIPTEYELWAADYNTDDAIDIMDIVQIVNCILSDCWTSEPTGDCIYIDGNVYETIQIGEQLWMAENLKVTHYNNEDEISYPSNEYFGNYDDGQYGVYDNDPANADIYGNLYNWAVVDDDRGVCPEGFHVPSDAEYTVLTDYLGGESVAGGKMKEAGLDHWNSPNTDATNESGFTGLPAGYRSYSNGSYLIMGTNGYFWSSSEYDSDLAWYRVLVHSSPFVHRNAEPKQFGFSVRCLGD